MCILLGVFLAHCAGGDAPLPSTGGAPDSGGTDSGSGDDNAGSSDATDGPVVLSDDVACVATVVPADLAVPSCDAPLPEASRLPRNFRPSLLNIKARIGDGGEAKLISRFVNAAACTADGGWFYDDDLKPTRVILCPATCEALSVPGSSLDFIVGCDLIPIPPP
jgi:hypothetical protein